MDGTGPIRKAYASILRNDFEQAIHWFEQAIALDPDNAAYHYKLSITCARSGRLAKAIHHASQAVAREPDNQTYLFHLGHLKAKELIARAEESLAQGEDPHMAVALLKEAVKLDPLSSEAHLLLAGAWAELEEYAHAVQALKESLRLNPGQQTALDMLEQYKRKLHAQLSVSE